MVDFQPETSIEMTKKQSTKASSGNRKSPALTVDELGWRHYSMARLMNVAVQRQQERVIAIMVRAGYTKIRLTHVNLTRNLDLEGNTITELANRAAMTKQAMGELVDQCEKIKIVDRTADPKDRRVWIVKFTDRGLQWLSDLKKAVAQAEAEMIDIVGEATFQTMIECLKTYNRTDLPALDVEKRRGRAAAAK